MEWGHVGAARGGCRELAALAAAVLVPAVRNGAAGRVGAMPSGPRVCPAPRRDGEPGGHGVAPAPAEEVGARPGLRALARLLPHQHLQAGQWPPARLPSSVCSGRRGQFSRPSGPPRPRGNCLRSRAVGLSERPGGGNHGSGLRAGGGTCLCVGACVSQGQSWDSNPGLWALPPRLLPLLLPPACFCPPGAALNGGVRFSLHPRGSPRGCGSPGCWGETETSRGERTLRGPRWRAWRLCVYGLSALWRRLEQDPRGTFL